MPDFIVIMNHALTAEQEQEARGLAKGGKLVVPPGELRGQWSAVPPEPENIREHIQPLREWLGKTAKPGDYLLVQGDFGATFLLVNFALNLGLVPLYATSRRETMETVLPDGSVRQERVFRHVRFRQYETITQSGNVAYGY